MDVEGLLAILLIFGGGTLFLLAMSPVGKALAERIRYGGKALAPPEPDHAVYDELDRLRTDVAELQERVDFTERLLAKTTSAAPDEVKQP
jgi:hypothetical protein